LIEINKLTTKKDLQFINSKLVETVKMTRYSNNKISEGEKYFVERINILEITVTEDNVIRGELEVDEGDPYSLLLLDRS
jgi:outer membrane protein assembly factor BamA